MRRQQTADREESAYLLEYGKRRVRLCADTLNSLAQILESGTIVMQTLEEETETGQEIEEDAFIQKREERIQLQRMLKGQELLADNLKEAAEMMSETARENVRFIRLGGRREKQIKKSLLGEGLLVQDVYLIQRGDDRFELSVSMKCKSKTTKTIEDAADYLSVLLDMRLVPARRNPYFIGQELVCIYFEEEPSFCFLTGAARAIKETESVSGDSYTFFNPDDGNLTIALSDGMGSGRKACKDSEVVVDFVQTLLETGVPARQAVQLINSAVAAQSKEDNMSTLDLCSVDLYEGSGTFLKVGASASYIKRGKAVEKVPAAALPLGAFGKADVQIMKKPLLDGDFIIMFTDGLVEDWPEGEGEFFITQLLERMTLSSPSEIANTLLQYAIERCQGRIRDDMTVLVAGVWENRRKD